MMSSRSNWFKHISLTSVWLWLLIFVLAPSILVFVTSFLKQGQSDFVEFTFTFGNYKKILDPVFFRVFVNSCYIAFLTTFLCLIIGYPFAYFIARMTPKWRRILLFLVIIPFWTSSLVRIYAIKIILLKTERMMSYYFPGTTILYTQTAVLIGLVYTMLPFMILPLFSNIEKLDYRLVEAAKDLGANGLQTFTKVVFPLTLPGIIAGSILVFLPVLGLFYVVDILWGAKELMIGNLIKNQFLTANDWPFGAASSVFMILLMALLMLVYIKSIKAFGESANFDDFK